MKSKTKLFGGTLAGALTLAGVLFPGLGRSSDDASDNARIEGTWRVTVTQRVCTTQAPIGPPFQSLLTFAQGGTMTGTTASTLYLPGQRSGDFGVWNQTDGHEVSAVEQAFIIFSTPFPLNPPLTQGSQIIKHSIKLTPDGNGFNDVASVQFFDVGNQPVAPTLTPGCATAVGQRLQ